MSGTVDSAFKELDLRRVPSPCYVIDRVRLVDNLKLLGSIADAADVRILLALKAFSCFAVADLIGQYLNGTAASGLWEARLGRHRFHGEVHSYAPGLKAGQLTEIESLSDHLIFNSLRQWARFGAMLSSGSKCSPGLRINPRHSEVETPLYDPCAAWSRLGVTAEQLADGLPDRIRGFHVHALCDQGFEPFDRLLGATEARFGVWFDRLDWLNLGGGQLITATDYPVDQLTARLTDLRRRTNLAIYLEPGTAVVLNAGALVTEVLDTGFNEGHFAVLDCSAICHMPDVIEAPYTPDVLGAEVPTDPDPSGAAICRLGGPTCLAGDIVGTYSFKKPPSVGDRLCILDQAYYTMVKSTTFNGTPLPAIAIWDRVADRVEVIREFSYQDFECRLA